MPPGHEDRCRNGFRLLQIKRIELTCDGRYFKKLVDLCVNTPQALLVCVDNISSKQMQDLPARWFLGSQRLETWILRPKTPRSTAIPGLNTSNAAGLQPRMP